jgi:butyryl-CoA dehydrogenase
MPVLFTPEEKEIFEKARAFGMDYMNPRAAKWEDDRKLPMDALEEVRKNGFFGIGCSKEYGGQGHSWYETALTYEGLAHGDGGFTFFLQLHNTLSMGLEKGYDELNDNVKSLLPSFVKGEKLLGFAFTDDSGGSDPFQTKAYAVKKDDGYHLYGPKSWVSNSLNADYFIVITHLKEGDDIVGMIMFLVPKGIPGFKIGDDIRRVGGNVMSCGRIEFNDAVLTDDWLLAEDGYQRALAGINIARVYVPAVAVGVAQRALDITSKYLNEREAFGAPLLDNQAIQFELAGLSAKLEAARWLTRRAATVMDTGEPLSVLASRTKCFVPDTALEITTKCAHLMGAIGLEWNCEVGRCLNAARSFKMVDGSTEVQLIVISRAIQKHAPTGTIQR